MVTPGSLPPAAVEMVNTTRFDMTTGGTDQEDFRSEGERPRRLVFPSSSGEIVEGFVDDEDRDGASEAGLEEYAPFDARPRSQVIKSVLESVDEVELRTLFSQRASLMKNIPRFLVGPYRNAMRWHQQKLVGLQGTKCCWRGVGKLFLNFPRIVSHRKANGLNPSQRVMNKRL